MPYLFRPLSFEHYSYVDLRILRVFSGNLQDGMTSLSGTNSIPLAAGGTASVPSAANSISPHPTSYLPTGASLSAQGTHIPTAPS
jgi:hypothetical protein